MFFLSPLKSRISRFLYFYFGIPEALERQQIFLEKLPGNRVWDAPFCKDGSLPIVNMPSLCADLFSEARTKTLYLGLDNHEKRYHVLRSKAMEIYRCQVQRYCRTQVVEKIFSRQSRLSLWNLEHALKWHQQRHCLTFSLISANHVDLPCPRQKKQQPRRFHTSVW